MKNKKGNAIIIGAIVIVVLLVVAGVAWIVGSRMRVPVKQATPNKQEKQKTETQPTPTDETANWQTYTDNQHGFEFKYPPNLVLGENEGDGISMETVEQNKSEYRNIIPAYMYIKWEANDGIALRGTQISFADGAAFESISKSDSGDFSTAYDIETVRGDTFYLISFMNKDKNSLTVDDKLILSTFKFTDDAASQPAAVTKLQKLELDMVTSATKIGSLKYKIEEVSRYRLANQQSASLYTINLKDADGGPLINVQDIPSSQAIVAIKVLIKNLSSSQQSLPSEPAFSAKYTNPELRAASQDAFLLLTQFPAGIISGKKSGEYTYVYSSPDYDVDHVVVDINGDNPSTSTYDLSMGNVSYFNSK